MPINGFLFVNRDAASLGDGTSLLAASEKSSIYRHAQKGRKRPRTSKTKRLSQKGNARNARCKLVKSTPEIPTGLSIRQAPNAATAQNSGGDEPVDLDHAFTERTNENLSPVWSSQQWRVDKSSVSPAPDICCSMDPFDTAPVRIDHGVQTLLYYYVQVYHVTVWPHKTILSLPTLYPFEKAVNRIVKKSMVDELLMYCLLSACAARLQNIDRLRLVGIENKDALYMHKALPMLRIKIENYTLDELDHVILCLGFLASTEAYRDNLAASLTHVRAAHALVEMKGGIMAMKDRNLQGMLLMSDLYPACIGLRPCLFGCEYDPGPVATLQLGPSELDSSTGDEQPNVLLDTHLSIIPDELRALVLMIKETYSIKSRLISTSMSSTRAFEVTDWIIRRNMATRNKLLALSTNDPRIHALRAVIIMWTLMSMNITGRVKTVKMMAPSLRGILLRIPSMEWQDYEELRLYINIMGYISATEGSETANWFADQCKALIGLPALLISTGRQANCLAEIFIELQRKFFYHAEVQGPCTRTLAHRLAGNFTCEGHSCEKAAPSSFGN